MPSASPSRLRAPAASRSTLRRAATRSALAMVAAGLAAGCGGPSPSPAPAAAEAAPADAGFAAPPTVASADWTPAGVALRGRAPPGARVRLAAPDGETLEAAAGADGGWAATAPAGDAPRLFAFSADTAGRTLRGEGAVALLPRGAEAPALLLRSASPAVPLGSAAPRARGAPRLVSIDFDSGGGLAASGVAPAGSTVRLTLDGAVVGQGQADASGRFAIPGVAAPVAAGVRRIAVSSPGGGAAAPDPAPDPATAAAADRGEVRAVALTPAPPLPAPFRTATLAEGWRIDWRPPGGGVQSAVAFSAAPAAAAAQPSHPASATPSARPVP